MFYGRCGYEFYGSINLSAGVSAVCYYKHTSLIWTLQSKAGSRFWRFIDTFAFVFISCRYISNKILRLLKLLLAIYYI